MSQKNWEIQSRVQKEYGKVEVDYGGSVGEIEDSILSDAVTKVAL